MCSSKTPSFLCNWNNQLVSSGQRKLSISDQSSYKAVCLPTHCFPSLLHPATSLAPSPQPTTDAKAAVIWRTYRIQASWVPESPFGGQLFGSPTSHIRKWLEKERILSHETTGSLEVLVTVDCIIHPDTKISLLCKSGTWIKRTKASKNDLKSSVLQTWIPFNKWGKCSVFRPGKNYPDALGHLFCAQ